MGASELAAGPVQGHDAGVDVLVPDQQLRSVLQSKRALTTAWPQHADQVQLLVQVLRIAETLAEALGTGVVLLTTPPSLTSSEVTVTHDLATLSAQALDASGRPVTAAATQPARVTGLNVRQVAVLGQAAHGRAG